MNNPFYLKVIPTEAPFCNREEEQKILIKRAEDCINTVLYSPRRYGKTSLIKRVQANLHQKKIETIYIDLSGIKSIDDICHNITTGIYSYVKQEEGLIKRFQKFFKNLRPVITTNLQDEFKVEFSPISHKTGLTLLEEVFSSFNELIKTSDAKFNIAIDEFQEITSAKESDKIEAFLRQEIQVQENISYIFSGSRQRVLIDIFNLEKRPFYKSSINMELKPLPFNKASDFIIKQFKNVDIDCSYDIAEKIVKKTEGYPYYMQRLCYAIFEITEETITKNDFEKGFSKMLEEESPHFEGMEKEIAEGQKKLLNALAIEPTKEIFGQSYTRKHQLKSISSIQAAKKRLISLDFIQEDEETKVCKLQDPIFKEWLIRKNMPAPVYAEVFESNPSPVKSLKEERVQKISEETTKDNKNYSTDDFIEAQAIEYEEKRDNKKEPVTVFISYSHEDRQLKESFLNKIKTRLKISKKPYNFIFSADTDVLVGGEWKEEILKKVEECDYGMLLLSANFLNSEFITKEELPRLIDKCLPVALGLIDIGRMDLKGLDEKQIYFNEEKKSFSECDEIEKEKFANRLANQIEDRVENEKDKKKKICEQLSVYKDERSKNYPEKYFVKQLATLEKIAVNYKDNKENQNKINVTDYLEYWLTESDAPFFALLGDMGMGKTFACRMFARNINKLNQEEPNKYPICIYIDLRFAESKDENRKVPNLKEVLQSSIDKTKDALDKTNITYDDIIKLVRQNKAMIIFDGLDEKATDFIGREPAEFIRELFSIRKNDGAKEGKILISSRTHYFKNKIEQNSLLIGNFREGRHSKDYLACTILGFNENQIQEYLNKRLKLDTSKIEKIINLLESIHNLKELASKPFTLSLITEFIPEIEEAKEKGEKINAVKLYEIMTNSWIERDFGRHEFDIEHKKILMQDIALTLFKKQKRNLSLKELETWLDTFLYNNPIIADGYRGFDRKVLKKDLRTATFIIRETDNDFGFAHTSLQEYFLACFIADTFEEKDEKDIESNLAIEIPSKETIDFLIQIFELDEEKLETAVLKIKNIFENKYVPKTSKLLLTIWQSLENSNLLTPNPKEIHLEGANLEKWNLKNLNLSKAFLEGANLKDSEFENCSFISSNFKKAKLENSVFLNCNLENSNFEETVLTGSIWRESILKETNWKNSILNKAEFVKCDLKDCENIDNNQNSYFIKSNPFKTPKLKNFKIDVFAGHQSVVSSCAISYDGKFIVSGSYDNTLKLWDVKTKKEIKSFKGHKDRVTSCAISYDGKFIVSGSNDKTLKLWDTKTGKEIKSFRGHKGWVSSCVISYDGKFIVSGSDDSTLKLWDTKTGKEIKSFKGHKYAVTSCVLSYDGKFIVSGSKDDTLKLWDIKTGKEIKSFRGHKGWVTSCAISYDGKFIVSGSVDSTLKLWDIKTGKEIKSFSGHKSPVTSCVLSYDEKFIVSGSYDKTLKLWDIKTGKEIKSFKGHKGWVRSCAISYDGKFIVSGSYDSTLKLWDIKTGKEIKSFKGHKYTVSSCVISYDGKFIVSGSYDSTLKLWDTKTGKEIKSFRGHKSSVTSCAISYDGKFIVSGSYDSTLKLWDIKTGKEIKSFRGHKSAVSSCVISYDGKFIVSGSNDSTLKLWDTKTGKEIKSFRGHKSAVSSCVISYDGKFIVSGSYDDTLKLWDTKTGKEIKSFRGHKKWVKSCAISKDNKKILSKDLSDNEILWDIKTGKSLNEKYNKQDFIFNNNQFENNYIQHNNKTLYFLPDDKLAVIDNVNKKIITKSKDMWRWVFVVPEKGFERYPIEILESCE